MLSHMHNYSYTACTGYTGIIIIPIQLHADERHVLSGQLRQDLVTSRDSNMRQLRVPAQLDSLV